MASIAPRPRTSGRCRSTSCSRIRTLPSGAAPVLRDGRYQRRQHETVATAAFIKASPNSCRVPAAGTRAPAGPAVTVAANRRAGALSDRPRSVHARRTPEPIRRPHGFPVRRRPGGAMLLLQGLALFALSEAAVGAPRAGGPLGWEWRSSPGSRCRGAVGRRHAAAMHRSRPGQQAGVVPAASGPRTTAFAVCSGAHERLARQFLAFFAASASDRPRIFAPDAAARGTLLGRWACPGARRQRLQFRVIVAATVASSRSPTARLCRPSIPARLSRAQPGFLLGIRNTLWVFRIVGDGCCGERPGWAVDLESTHRGRHCHNVSLCVPPTRGTP